jgi:hypothetical protein
MTIKRLKCNYKMGTGGRIPYIDPSQFTYKDPNFDLPPPPRPVDFGVASPTRMATVDNWHTPGINPDNVPGSSAPSGSSVLNKAAGYANSIAPFASNIVNAFRKVPKPAQPIMDSAPVLQKVNMDADRSAVSRELNAGSAAADRAVDGNTAESIRQFNMGTKLDQFSRISESERNANTQIANQQAMISAQVAAGNNAKRDQYNNDLKEGQIAQSREQSANFSNAADKYMAINNEKSKAALDKQKAGILMSLYSQSGVLRRQGAMWQKAGQPDPFGQDYKWLNDEGSALPAPSGSLKRFGGSIKFKY